MAYLIIFILAICGCLNNVKKIADYLIVAVQNEEYVLKYKPSARMLYSTEERVKILEGLRVVDEVYVYETVCPRTLEQIDFDILALGEDHRGGRFDEVVEWCNSHDKKVVRLKRTEGISSTIIKDKVDSDLTTDKGSFFLPGK